MRDKIGDFVFDHPVLAGVVCVIILFPFAMFLAGLLASCVSFIFPSDHENVKNAQYVLYTAEGEMKAVEAETIVDMDTGYQYRIFEIDGQYVCAPAIDEDGMVYKTVE